MVDIKSPKCKADGCTKGPNFNFEGETKALYCVGCAEPGMVDIKNPKCKADGCTKQPSYGIPCNLPTRCSGHKQNGMIIRPRGKCLIKDCKEVAKFGITKPIHCEIHKTDNDEDLVERTCPKCSNVDIIIDGLCVNFCGLTEKHKTLKKNQKVEEKRVYKVLKGNFREPCEYNVRVSYTCGGRNSEEKEYGYDFGIFKVFIEVDERQHKSYCELGEVNRMKNIYMNEGGIPIVFIRYNPHNFNTDGKRKVFSKAKREELLIKWLKRYEEEGAKYDLCVNYLFYDEWTPDKIFEYEIEPYSSVGNSLEQEEYICEKCNKEFYIKSMYAEHVTKCR